MPVHNFYVSPGPNPGHPPKALEWYGPLLEVEISVHPALAEHLTRQRLPIPESIRGWSLIDTGASHSAVDERAIKALQVPPTGTVRCHTPSGLDIRELYPAVFRFPTTPFGAVHFAQIPAVSLRDQDLVALVGRDVLSKFVLTFDGLTGRITLAQPD